MPAWYLFGKLIIHSVNIGKSAKKMSFWTCLFAYFLVIVLPYIPLLLAGEYLSDVVNALVVAALVLAIFLPMSRIFLPGKVESILWGIYGYVYDGLLSFYPYTNLVKKAVDRLKVSSSDEVLDLGCGTGNACVLILKNQPKSLLAADGSASMLKQAKRKLQDSGNTKIYKQDAVKFLKSLPDNSQDKILMINLIYAVHNRAELWQHAIRVIKKEGHIVMTSSDRGGSWSIIKEHLSHHSFLSLLRPKLTAVFLIDGLISSFASSGGFHFISKEEMVNEISQAGGKAEDIERCYGGSQDGVNLMMTIRRA